MADNLPNQPYTGAQIYADIPAEKSGAAWWVWVLSTIFVCGCLACAGIVGIVYYFGREPENVSLSYSMPAIVKKGENFDLTITISNTGTKAITVADIDLDRSLGDSILDGVMVLETEPHLERDYSISGIKSFKYDTTIDPDETKNVTFHMQAITVGEFGGPIGIYVGNLAKSIDYIGIIVQE